MRERERERERERDRACMCVCMCDAVYLPPYNGVLSCLILGLSSQSYDPHTTRVGRDWNANFDLLSRQSSLEQ